MMATPILVRLTRTQADALLEQLAVDIDGLQFDDESREVRDHIRLLERVQDAVKAGTSVRTRPGKRQAA